MKGIVRLRDLARLIGSGTWYREGSGYGILKPVLNYQLILPEGYNAFVAFTAQELEEEDLHFI